MKPGIISTIVLFLAACFSTKAQDIYSIRFRYPGVLDTATYNAFFSVAANGTGFIRVNPGNNSFTIEMEIEENYALDKEGNPDPAFVYYEGKNPRVVKGLTKNKLAPLTCWFKINTDNSYDPWAVTPVSVKSAPAEKNLSSVEFIKSVDLVRQKDLVSSYFADTSLYYKNIFSPKARGGVLSKEDKENTHLYLIVVASTNDKHIGTNCLTDARKVINYFTDVAMNVLGLLPRNVHIDSVFGNNYSRASVEAALNKIPTANKINNMVIFYYSGHGFHNKNFPDKVFPFFDLRDPAKQLFYKDLETQTLNVKDIYDNIKAKGPRFNLVLSDCCNDTVAAPKRKWWEPVKKKGLTKANFDNVKALFMSKQPVNYLMTAASMDEQAVVTPSFSSYFTYFFLQSLTTYLSPEKGFPSWPQVFASAQNQTIRQVSGLPCKETNCPKQTPKLLLPVIR